MNDKTIKRTRHKEKNRRQRAAIIQRQHENEQYFLWKRERFNTEQAGIRAALINQKEPSQCA